MSTQFCQTFLFFNHFDCTTQTNILSTEFILSRKVTYDLEEIISGQIRKNSEQSNHTIN